MPGAASRGRSEVQLDALTEADTSPNYGKRPLGSPPLSDRAATKSTRLSLRSTVRKKGRGDLGQLSMRSSSSSSGGSMAKSPPSYRAGPSGSTPLPMQLRPSSAPMPTIEEGNGMKPHTLPPSIRKALLTAVENNEYLDCVNILAGVRVPIGTVKHDRLGTLMHMAVLLETGAARMVTLLARHGANVDALFHRETPLIQAASLGRFDVCRSLIAAGASTAARDAAGSTLLHIVARSGRVQAWALCQLLLTREALGATDAAGLTAVEAAQRYSKDPFLVAKLEAATRLAEEQGNDESLVEQTELEMVEQQQKQQQQLAQSPVRDLSPAARESSPSRRSTSPPLIKSHDVTGLLKMKREYELRMRRVEQESFDAKAKSKLEKSLRQAEERSKALLVQTEKMVATERMKAQKAEATINQTSKEAARELQAEREKHEQERQELASQIQQLQNELRMKAGVEDALAALQEKFARKLESEKLPGDIEQYPPLNSNIVIKQSSEALEKLEEAIAGITNKADVTSQNLLAELGSALDQHKDLVRKELAERAREECRMKIISDCDSTIAAGNRDLNSVYGPAFELIKASDINSFKQWELIQAELQAKVVGDGAPRQRTTNIAEMYLDAAVVKPSFVRIVTDIIASVNAQRGSHAAAPVELFHDHKRLKSASRTVEKVEMFASSMASIERQQQLLHLPVCDVVRAMIIAYRMPQLMDVVRALINLAESEAITILRVKNRWSRPTGSGWRDVIINFRLRSDESRHVCEVQLVHAAMLTARRGFPGHTVYTRVRDATEMLESLGLDVPWEIDAQATNEATNGADAAKLGSAVARRCQLGQSVSQLLPLFGCTPFKLRLGGYEASALRDSGQCTASSLKEAGYTAEELANAGYLSSELESAGFFHDELPHVKHAVLEQIKAAEASERQAKTEAEEIQAQIKLANQEVEALQVKAEQLQGQMLELERSGQLERGAHSTEVMQRVEKLRKGISETAKKHEEALVRISKLETMEKDQLGIVREKVWETTEASKEMEWAHSIVRTAIRERMAMEQTLARLLQHRKERERGLVDQAQQRLAVELKKAEEEASKQQADELQVELERLSKESMRDVSEEKEAMRVGAEAAEAARVEVEQNAKVAQSKLQKTFKETSRLGAASERAREQVTAAVARGEKQNQLQSIKERLKVAEEKERRHKEEVHLLESSAEALVQEAREANKRAKRKEELAQQKVARHESAQKERYDLMLSEAQRCADRICETSEVASAVEINQRRLHEEVETLHRNLMLAKATEQVKEFTSELQAAQTHAESMRKAAEEASKRLKEAKKRGDYNVEALRRAQIEAMRQQEQASRDVTQAVEAVRAAESSETACTTEIRVAAAAFDEYVARNAEKEKAKSAQHAQARLDAEHAKRQQQHLESELQQAWTHIDRMKADFEEKSSVRLKDAEAVLNAQKALTSAAQTQVSASEIASKASQKVFEILQQRIEEQDTQYEAHVRENASQMKSVSAQLSDAKAEAAAARAMLEAKHVQVAALEEHVKLIKTEYDAQLDQATQSIDGLLTKLAESKIAMDGKSVSEIEANAKIAEMTIALNASKSLAGKMEADLEAALKELVIRTTDEQKALSRVAEQEIELHYAKKRIDLLQKNLDEANNSATTHSAPGTVAYVAADKRARVVSYELSQYKVKADAEKEAATKLSAERSQEKISERTWTEKKTKQDIDVAKTETRDAVAESEEKTKETVLNLRRRLEWQAEHELEEVSTAKATAKAKVNQARHTLMEDRTAHERHVEKETHRLEQIGSEARKAAQASIDAENARLDAKVGEERRWLDDQKRQMEERLVQTREMTKEAERRAKIAVEEKQKATSQMEEAKNARQNNEENLKTAEEELQQAITAARQQKDAAATTSAAELKSTYASSTVMVEWETAKQALVKASKEAETETQKAAKARADEANGEEARWKMREQLSRKDVLRRMEAALGERAPDVKVDLLNRQLLLNQSIRFLENRAVFADESAAARLLQQLAFVAYTCDELLQRKGRPLLLVSFKGHTARGGPYYDNLAYDRARACWREVLRRYGEYAGRPPFDGQYKLLAAEGRDYERRFTFERDSELANPMGGTPMRVEVAGASDLSCQSWAECFGSASAGYPFSFSATVAEAFASSCSATDMLMDIQARRIEEGAHVGYLTVTLARQKEDDLDLHVMFPSGGSSKHHIFYENRQGGGAELDLLPKENMHWKTTGKVVENIYFKDPRDHHGVYEIWVARREGARRPKVPPTFEAVIEIDCKMYCFEAVYQNRGADEKKSQKVGDDKKDNWFHVADIQTGADSWQVVPKDATMQSDCPLASYLQQEHREVAKQGKLGKPSGQ